MSVSAVAAALNKMDSQRSVATSPEPDPVTFSVTQAIVYHAGGVDSVRRTCASIFCSGGWVTTRAEATSSSQRDWWSNGSLAATVSAIRRKRTTMNRRSARKEVTAAIAVAVYRVVRAGSPSSIAPSVLRCESLRRASACSARSGSRRRRRPPRRPCRCRSGFPAYRRCRRPCTPRA